MSDPAAMLFDGIADDYDRFRPSYPAALVDEACTMLAAGSRVLEVGCGTGQLTTALLARGLRVEAVDPGPHMVQIARRRSPRATFHLRMNALPVDIARTVEQELGQVRTTSAYLRLDAERREQLERRLVAVMQAGGGGHCTSTYATLVTARETRHDGRT